MKRILALDLATESGWAVQRGDGVVVTGIAVFVSRLNPGWRWSRFYGWLNDLIEFEKPELVVYESPFVHMKHRSGLGLSYGFVALTELLASKHEVKCYGVAPRALKKWATGHGNADKLTMLRFARSMGWNLSNDNEIDARFLLHFASERSERAQKAIAQSGTGAGL